MTRRVALALGSNLGGPAGGAPVDGPGDDGRPRAGRLDPAATLQAAVTALLEDGALVPVAVSSLYATAPVGGPVQPDYVNAVLVVDTALPALDLLALAQAVERRFGRERGVRFGPRTLDVDLLVVGDETVERPELVLPHPRAAERAFVLVPWAEVDPEAEVPGLGRVRDLLVALGRVDPAAVRRLPAALVLPPGVVS